MRHHRYLVTFEDVNAAAALTDEVLLHTLLQGEVPVFAKIVGKTAFAGTGVTNLQMVLVSATSAELNEMNHDATDAANTSAGSFEISDLFVRTEEASAGIYLQVTATGANLDQLTAGEAYIDIYTINEQ